MGRGATEEKKITPHGRRKPSTELPSKPQAEKLYSWFHEPSKTEVMVTEYHPVGKTELETKGVLMRGKKQIGEWTRWMRQETLPDGTKRLVAKNSWLKIFNERDQGTGFGRAWTEELEKRYKRMGVHHVEVWATDNGVFVWAKTGYRFHANDHFPPDYSDYPSDRPKEAAEAAKFWNSPHAAHYVEQLLEEEKITKALVDDTNQRFLQGNQRLRATSFTEPALTIPDKIITTPGEILAIGDHMPWIEDGQRMWLGKALLIHAPGGWRGWKML